MTLLGKIFTVLIFIMSIVFMSFAVVTFATHQNWRNTATGLTATIAQLKNSNAALVTEKNRLLQELATEQAARRAALATLQGKLAALQQTLNSQAAVLQEKTSALTAQTQAAKTAEETLNATSKELATSRSELALARSDRDRQFRRAVEITDKYNQANSMLDVMTDRNNSLQEQFAQLQRVATDHGLNQFVSSDAPPKIDAKILGISEASGLVEISVGSDDGIKAGHIFEVYRGNKYLGRITIRETEHDRAVGEINKKMQRSRIVVGDHVTTKLS